MEFARLLVVAVVLFGVMLVMFGGDMASYGGGDDDGQTGKFGPVKELDPVDEGEDQGDSGASEGSFFVGTIENTDFRHIRLSDQTFEVAFQEESRNLGRINHTEVKRGIFSNDPQNIEFNLSQDKLERISSMEMEFEVKDTNKLNRMYISLNGQNIYSGYPDGRRPYTVDINKSLLEEDNEMEISAGSSSWRFWAPTVYMLEEVKVNIEILEEKERNFEFSLTENQADNFRMGRLVLAPEEFEAESPLSIKANGKTVINKTPELPDRKSLWLEFDDAEMQEGENNISFSTGRGSSYRFKSGKMVYFWLTDEKTKSTRTIDTSTTEYNDLPGEISFDIDAVEGEPEKITVYINTAEGEERALHTDEDPEEGKTISIEITKDDVAVGENTLEFVVGGEGGFYLSDFDVDY